MNHTRLTALSAWAKDQLTSVILPWWCSDYILDHEHGGIYGVVTLDMERNNSEPRGLTLTGRMLWVFSAAYRRLHGQIYADRAKYVYEDLKKRFYDPEFGGAFTTVSETGEVLTTDKPNYCEAFFIMGLAEYYHAFGDEEALRMAMECFRLMETRAKTAPGLYAGNMTRDWQISEGFGFGRRGMKSPFPDDAVMFAHHLFQAYLRLFEATRDPEVAQALREMAEVLLDKLYDPEHRDFMTIVTKDGKRIGTNQSFGHDCEISYLLLNVVRLVGDENLQIRARKTVTTLLTEVLAHDFDPYGSLYNGGDLTSTERSPVHVWWGQAEAVSAMLAGFDLTGDDRFLDACEKQAAIIDKYFVNRDHGDWYNNVEIDENGGRVVDGMHGFDKLNSGKCPFHNSQMCMEVMARIERMTK